jgi:type III secretion system FlhB-like substrate exporter
MGSNITLLYLAFKLKLAVSRTIDIVDIDQSIKIVLYKVMDEIFVFIYPCLARAITKPKTTTYTK